MNDNGCEKKDTSFKVILDDEQMVEIKKLMELCGFKTNRDILLNATALLAWTVEEKLSGRTVASVDESAGKYKEIVMPFFQNLRKIKS